MDLFNFFLNGLYFTLVTIVAFFIPGNLLVSRLKLPLIVNITSSFILGICLWATQAFILGYLNLRDLTYFYVIVTFVTWVIINFKKVNFKFRHKIKLDNKDLIIFLILILGISLQVLSTIGNAIPFKDGLFFCCGAGDTIYYGALVKELINSFPPNEAAIFDSPLKNYHYLSNLITADLVRIFKLSFIPTTFNFIPVFFSILFGLVGFSLGKTLNLGKNFIILFLFLLFFFSDIFYILTLFTTKTLVFNVSTIETSLALWISYSRFFAVVVFLQALIFLVLWIKNRNLKFLLPLVFTSGVLIGIKVYIGILFLMGIISLMFYLFLKKDIKNALSLTSIFILSALFFIPVNSSSGGIIFTGFWRTRDLIVNPNLNLSHLELARQIFEKSENAKRYIFDLFFFGIYILFSFGILLLSFFNPVKNLKRIPVEIHIFLISSFVSTFILGMFFIQKTGGSNSGQFLISGFLIGTIYAALFLDYLLAKNKFIFRFLVLIFVLLTIPKTIYQASINVEKYQNKNGVVVSNDELRAFEYINNHHPNSVFIVDPALNYSCLTLPLLTSSKSYFCSMGSPADRGIKPEEYENEIKSALKGDENLKKNFDYILTTNNNKVGKKQKVIYKNKSYMILKYD